MECEGLFTSLVITTMASTSGESEPISREGLRLLILHEYRLGSSARLAADRINHSMGANTTSKSTVIRWYQRFGEGQTTLEDEPRSGRPPVFDVDALTAAVEEDPR